MKYGCAVTRMKKTSKIQEALMLKGLSDSQIQFAKVWRFSNRVYTEGELDEFKAQSEKAKKDRDYKRLFEENGISQYSMKFYASDYTERLMCDNKIDAVLSKEAEIHRLLAKRTGSVTIQKLDREHRVYAFRLNEAVLEESKFKEANPNLDEIGDLFYIGMTSKSREERFIEHINAPDSGRDIGARFMRKYSLQSFEEADATHELFTNPQYPHAKLTYGEALNTERYYGENLKSKRCATWWN